MSQTQEGLLPLNSLQPAGLVQELKAEAQRREYRTPRLSGRRCSRGLSRRAKAGGVMTVSFVRRLRRKHPCRAYSEAMREAKANVSTRNPRKAKGCEE
jgi:hypothetical protein